MDTDDICLRREHAHGCDSARECSASLADRACSQRRPQSDGEITEGNRTPAGRARRHHALAIEAVVAYMLQNLDKPVQMTALGTLAGVSMSHFYYFFKLTTGRTPNNFLIHARMRRACQLLRGADLSVKEVAAVLGYNDQFYFSRLFKTVNGVSPREFRAATPDAEDPRKRVPPAAMKRGPLGPLAPFLPEPQPNPQCNSIAKR